MAKTSTVEERVEALLRRGGRVRAPELVKLIHEINPTDLGLPPAAERQRYVLKSRLQSLLIQQFPDEIVVSPMPAQEGVVALHYRPHDRDACHAIVSDLEDDARSFVRLQLDLAADGGTRSDPTAKEEEKKRPRSAPAPVPRSAPDDPRELVRLGHEALEAYDFERAQACFEEAFSRSNGGTAEALALLEFLVDYLAAYPAALEHEARLAQAALRDERVRALFAFAAANVGDVTACRRFIAGTEGHHAAAAWALLARLALARSDLSEAETCLAAARRLEPGLPELVTLAADASRRQAEARQPEEEELQQLLLAGDEEAAARRAGAILDRWPESTSARKVQRHFEARRRAREAEALRRRGEEAYAAAQFDDAAAHWRQATALGAEGLGARIAEASSRAEARLQDQRIQAVEAALSASASPESLSSYLALEPSERQILRARTKLLELDWLEQVRRGSPERDRGSDILAVVALSRAAKLSRGAAADDVLALLAQHEARLRKLEPARQLIESAQRARERVAVQVAEEQLREARRACVAGDLDEAIRLASHPAAAVLRDEAAVVLDDARARQQRRRRLERYEAAVARGELFDALDVVREAGTDAAESPQHWGPRRAEVARLLRQELAVDVVPCPDGVDTPEYGTAMSLKGEPVPCLASSGDHVFWATAHGCELFVRRFSLSGQRVDLLVSASTPEPLEYPDVLLDGTSLWLLGNSGAVLELSTETWDVLRWYPAAAFEAAGEIVEEVMLVPGTQFLWISARMRRGGDDTIRIFKLGQARPIRDLRGAPGMPSVPGPAGASVFLRGFEREGRLCAPAGNVTLHVPAGVQHVAMLPRGGYVGSSGTEGDDAVVLTWFDEHGKTVATATVPDAFPENPHVLVTSSAARSAIVQYDDVRDARRCAAFSFDEGGRPLHLLWTCEIPYDSILAQDVGGVHAALVWPTARSLSARVLGREAPDCPAEEEFHRGDVPWLKDEYFCGHPPPERSEEQGTASTSARMAKDQPSDLARRRFVGEAIEKLRGDPVGLIRLACELRSWQLPTEASTVQAFARDHFPEHPRVHLYEADELARAEGWARIHEVLTGLDVSGIDSPGQAHAHHLGGLALYHEGHYEEAALEMEEAERVPQSSCVLASWSPWLRFLAHPTGSPPEDPAARLLASLVHADLLLAAGDCVQAAEELDTRVAWTTMDVQSGARLAQAMLLQPDGSPAQSAHKRLALAAYLHKYAESSGRFRRTLPLGSWSWAPEELADVASRAESWLARHRGR